MVWAQSIRPACTRLCARDTAVFVRQVSQTRRTLLGEPTDNEAKTNAAPSWQDLVPKQPSSGTRATAKLGSTLSRLQNETEEVWRLEQERRNLIDKAFVPRFEANETYDAFDFTLQKQALDFQKIRFPKLKDRFKEVKLDPLLLWKDPSTLSHFVSTNGSILAGHETGNKRKTQKRLAKAIRRCRAAGLLSYVHKSVDQLPKGPLGP